MLEMLLHQSIPLLFWHHSDESNTIQLCEAPLPQRITCPHLLTLYKFKCCLKVQNNNWFLSYKIFYKGIGMNLVKPFVPNSPFLYPLTLYKFTRCLKTQQEKTLDTYLIKYVIRVLGWIWIIILIEIPFT